VLLFFVPRERFALVDDRNSVGDFGFRFDPGHGWAMQCAQAKSVEPRGAEQMDEVSTTGNCSQTSRCHSHSTIQLLCRFFFINDEKVKPQ
jgi:hypothetical protein